MKTTHFSDGLKGLQEQKIKTLYFCQQIGLQPSERAFRRHIGFISHSDPPYIFWPRDHKRRI